MMNILRMWSKLLVLLTMVSQIGACYGPVWPSRGMAVKSSSSGPSALEVKNVVVTELQSQGFVDIGKGGLDQIRNQKTGLNFEGPNDLLVFVGVDRVDEVRVRVSQNRKIFTPEANRVFESIAAALEVRWPNSVIREPKPAE
jgi:hypothetical protein